MATVVGYLATAWILLAYWRMSATGRPRAFHLANAVGCLPIALTEVLAGAWPALVLTVAFGILGWVGLHQETREALDYIDSRYAPLGAPARTHWERRVLNKDTGGLAPIYCVACGGVGQVWRGDLYDCSACDGYGIVNALEMGWL